MQPIRYPHPSLSPRRLDRDIRDVITRRNLSDQHGKTSMLTSDEIDALCAYVLSL